MKKLLIAIFVIIITPSVIYAQENTKTEKKDPSWGGQVEINYVSIGKKEKIGWYGAAEYGARFAPNTVNSAILAEGGMVTRVHKKSIFLAGAGIEYSYTEKKIFPLINTAYENEALGLGIKYIFESEGVFEFTAIKFIVIGDFRFAIGGGYTTKEKVPLLKIAIPFEGK